MLAIIQSLHVLPHLILKTPVRYTYNHCPKFLNEEMEAENSLESSPRSLSK